METFMVFYLFITSVDAELVLGVVGDSELLFGGKQRWYLGCRARISSKETSSAGWMILLAAPIVLIVFSLLGSCDAPACR